ncbi:MAG: Smr/MutS family protein [Bacteroidales bacterium]|nr:Smr/MutS family protein [Candidatus Colicola faecequi]
MKVGDKVRFLDSVGEGVVRRIDEQKGLAYVEDQDGFEIPTTLSQCVVIKNPDADIQKTYRPVPKLIRDKQLAEKQQPKPQPQAGNGKKEEKKDDLLEVDLHVEALRPGVVMNRQDALQLQIQTFRKTMGVHLKHKGQRIVFIHGKGDGVLKQEILRLLHNEYRTCFYMEASMQKYGSGATMVMIN